MSYQAGIFSFMVVVALSYVGLVVLAARRRGPGRRSIVAAGLCGVAGTVIPLVSGYNELTGGPDILNDGPEIVGAALIVGSFSAFVGAQILLLVGLLRAWRAREALPSDP
ncbi:hypothetical protein [Alienimonas sp. DA493]|uniref:hypothetical protein n=1 Tax=Alienimonas sp. DA493 TaxID=3373605 RepID=UPI0037552719